MKIKNDIAEQFDEEAVLREWEASLRESDPAYQDYILKAEGKKEIYMLDEYIQHLIDGNYKAQLSSRLQDYIWELSEEKWFQQYPLINKWRASQILHRGARTQQELEWSVDILEPFAEEGHLDALFDIGYCYKNGYKYEESYEKAIFLWIRASNGGYRKAQLELMSEYERGNYKVLPIEIKFFFVHEIERVFIQDRQIDKDTIILLEEKDKKKLLRFEKEIERLGREYEQWKCARDMATFLGVQGGSLYNFQFKEDE